MIYKKKQKCNSFITSENRKWLMRVIRSIAYKNGASLYNFQCSPYNKLS